MTNRRDFLQTVILGTGSVYLSSLIGCKDANTRKSVALVNKIVPAESPFSHHAQNYQTPHDYLRDGAVPRRTTAPDVKCDVVIIGAGPSGLSAAYALSKEGYSVVVLENEDRPGGAAVFSSYRGLRFPLASIYFVEANPMIQELCDFAGTKPIQAPEDAIVLQKQYFYDYWQDAVIDGMPIQPNDKAAMRRFRDDILAMKDVPPYPLPTRLTGKLAELDATTVRAFCARYNSSFLTDFMDLYARSSMGATIDETNAYSLLNFYSGEIAKTPDTKRLSFDGGLGGFTEKLGEKLTKAKILTSHCATRVHNDKNSVLVEAVSANEGVRISAAFAIVATQKFMVPRLIPELPADQRAAIAKLSYSPMLTVHLCSTQPIMPTKGFDTWYPEAANLFTDIIDPKTIGAAVDGEAYVASVYVPFPTASRAKLQDESFVVDYARRVATTTIDLMGQSDPEKITEIYTFAWGHSMVQARPGTHNGPAQLASRPWNKIYFANTDSTCVSAFENAIAEGFRCAEQVSKKLRRSGMRRFITVE